MIKQNFHSVLLDEKEQNNNFHKLQCTVATKCLKNIFLYKYHMVGWSKRKIMLG